MTDRSAVGQNDPNGEPRGETWARIAAIVIVVALVVVGGFLLFGGDDDDATTATTDAGTVAPSLPGDSVPAATTPAPGTAPVVPPGTDPPSTEPPSTGAPVPSTEAPSDLSFTIGGIDDGGTIPVEFTCDGDNESPVVDIESIPEGVLQLAMVVDDPDAPTADPFVHWLVYNIAGNAAEIVDASDDFTYGRNDAGTSGWMGPCPPEGDGSHVYVFTLYGLNAVLELEPDLDGREVAEAIEGNIVADATVTAEYERAS